MTNDELIEAYENGDYLTTEQLRAVAVLVPRWSDQIEALIEEDRIAADETLSFTRK